MKKRILCFSAEFAFYYWELSIFSIFLRTLCIFILLFLNTEVFYY